MNIDIFSNQVGVNRLFALVYSNQDNNPKRLKSQKYYWPNSIIKNYNIIINGKNFYDQPIDSDIKRYKEINNETRWRLYFWMFVGSWLYQKPLQSNSCRFE